MSLVSPCYSGVCSGGRLFPMAESKNGGGNVAAHTMSFCVSDLGLDATSPTAPRNDGGSFVVLGKMLSCKPLSRNTILAVLNKAWDRVEQWTLSELKPGIFKISFKFQKDMDTVLLR